MTMLTTATPADGNDDDVMLYRTATGGRLHIRRCPHVFGADVIPSSDSDRATMPVCLFTQGELNGEGRTSFDTVEDALAFLNAARADRPQLAKLLRQATFDGIHVPFSRSYVAVTANGQGVAWAGKTYVDYIDRPTVLLPSYHAGTGTGSTPAADKGRWGEMCLAHNEQRSVNGACGKCD